MKILRTLTKKKLWKNKLLWTLFICSVVIAWIPPNSDEIKARLGRVTGFDGIKKGFLVIGIEPDPCSREIGISVEDGRHIFCKSSFFNATLVGNDIVYGGPGKRETDGSSMYADAIERVTGLQLGKSIDEKGNEVWAISKQQLIEAYPHKTFPVTLNGEEGTAIDYSELFFEILLTAQKNREEIELLKEENRKQQAEIDAIKKALNMDTQLNFDTKNTLKVFPNPTINGQLTFEYEIPQTVQNATIFIYNMQGQMMEYIPINTNGEYTLKHAVDYPKGMYNCTLLVDGKLSAQTKMAIQ